MGKWLSTRSVASLVALGLTIREGFSFWTGHPFDMEIWLRNAYYVSKGANPYVASMPPVPGISFAYLDQPLPSVGYLPLWSLILASLYWVYSIIPWTNPYILYFLVKQPPIVGDTLLGYLMYKAILRWGGTPEAASRALRFWMFFPYAIIISSIWGMFDALVAVLVIASLLFSDVPRRYTLLGVGILLKFIPLIFVPYYFFRSRRVSKWGAALAIALPSVFTYLVFLSSGWDYAGLKSLLLFNLRGTPQGMTYGGILTSPPLHPYVAPFPSTIGPLLNVVGLLWIPAVSIAGFAASRLFPKGTARAEVQALMLIIATFFLTRWAVNEQFQIYLLALLLIDTSMWHPERRPFFHFLWVLSLIFLVANNTLMIRFLAPILPAAGGYEFQLNNLSALAWARYALLAGLGVASSLIMVQLVLLLIRPGRYTVPWLWRPFAQLRRRARRSTPGPQMTHEEPGR